MRIQFEGDWTPEDAQTIAQVLQKSLSMGDSGLAELTPVSLSSDIPALLSGRQRKLLELLRKMGTTALLCEPEEECADRPDWEEYGRPSALSKALGQLKTTEHGTYTLNANGRWQRFNSEGSSYTPAPQFSFAVVDGVFGMGVYFPVLDAPQGGVRVRVRLNLKPEQLIDASEFYELDADLSQDTETVLDHRNVRAIVQTQGNAAILLVVRHIDDLIPLGVLKGSGKLQGDFHYALVKLDEREDHWVADLELIEDSQSLNKAAGTGRLRWESASLLKGSPLVRTSAPELDRSLVRKAVDRCKLDGVDLSTVQIKLSPGVPDFLPKMTHAFCLPSDGVVWLCPHDPQGAIGGFCESLATRLQNAVQTGAMPGDIALDILARAARLSPQWWLESLIKTKVGAILCDRQWGIFDGGEVPGVYMDRLVGRGVQFWGNRRSVLECMAEDFRCAYDPAGVPNLITLEFDAAVPALARASQQTLLSLLKP